MAGKITFVSLPPVNTVDDFEDPFATALAPDERAVEVQLTAAELPPVESTQFPVVAVAAE